MFALATAALLLGLEPLAREPVRRVGRTALLAAFAALVVDVYLY
ncbi:hypothetical protein [Amycolatopsis australiensis]|uniref:Uncharacterized protein n=1 Tax=Amycolatopsis australiensis TaxID=546364 RepID=A0A1K1SVQ1_9PSEU|nr:hypothetical protein [Amycolatopsis australiensis]SFW88409.1 hypothetical protein SAMN04489730_6952 [Amycolatopsis australiensis]